MPPDDALWYLAYGSNMSAAVFVERRGMRPLAHAWGTLEGHRLCFDLPVGPGGRACANVVRSPGDRVVGVLWRITPEDAARLDRSEGVHVGIYHRVAVEVRVDGGDRRPAFTYASSYRTPGRRPSARYLGLLLDGARTHGLPPDWVAWLEGFDLAFDERTASDGRTVDDHTVRFYFAYDSASAFLASTAMDRALASLNVVLDLRPVHRPPAPDGAEPRAADVEDVRRLAHACGLRLAPGPAADARLASLGCLFASADGRGRAYHAAVYAAHFLESQDVGRRETLAAVAVRAGLDRARFLAALDDPAWDAALAASRAAAETDGVRGVPSFVFRGRIFSGHDGLEELVGAIRAAHG
jgi:2-hydroxychromene-2-carboxylate isomerase